MIKKSYYQDTIQSFQAADCDSILGQLTSQHEFSLVERQRNAWQSQIILLKGWLLGLEGYIYFACIVCSKLCLAALLFTLPTMAVAVGIRRNPN